MGANPLRDYRVSLAYSTPPDKLDGSGGETKPKSPQNHRANESLVPTDER